MAISESDLAKIELSSDEQKEFEKWAKGEESPPNSKGSLQTGKIIKINSSVVMVDIGDKSERRLDISEITDKDGNVLFKEGDEIALFVNSGRISHKKAKQMLKAKEDIEAIKQNMARKISRAKSLM